MEGNTAERKIDEREIDEREIEERIVAKYFMLKKSSLLYFLGGAIAFLFSTSFVIYEIAKNAAKDAISSSAAHAATAEVETLREKARASVIMIDKRAAEAALIAARLENTTPRLDAIETNISTMGKNVQATFDLVGQEIGKTRAEIASLVVTDDGRVVSRPAKSQVTEDGYYIVLAGDSAAKIAKKFSVKIDALDKANPGVDWTKIYTGQKVKIPR
jgi:LysM repeat protein